MQNQGTKTRGLFEQARTYTPKAKPFILPNGDKQHPCGCQTFWFAWPGVNATKAQRSAPTLFYRHACSTHKAYADRLGIIAQAEEVKL